MEREYNSVVKQTRVKYQFCALRLDNYKKNSADTIGALEMFSERILNLSRQVPVSHRGEAQKIEFLRGAVIGHLWAKELLSRVVTAGISFQQFFAELEITVQLEPESAATAASPVTSSVVPSIIYESQHITNFAGQVKYVRKNFLNRPQTSCKRLCINCGSESHVVKKSPHLVNFSRAATSHIRNLRHKKRLMLLMSFSLTSAENWMNSSIWWQRNRRG